MTDLTPTAEDKFSFGLWTVGWQGVDVFGGAIRPPMDPARRGPPAGRARCLRHHLPRQRRLRVRRRRGREGAPPRRRCAAPWTRPASVVPMVTTNLFSHPVFRDGGFTNNDRDVRRFAIRKVADNIDLAAVARCRGLRRLGRPRGRRVRCQQGRPGRARPLQRGLQRARAAYVLEQGYDIRFAIEPKPNEPRGDILLPTIGHALAFINELEHPELVGLNPEVGHEEMAGLNFAHGLAQALWHGKLFHIDLNGQHGPRFDQDLRFGAGNVRGAFWTVDILESGGYDGPRHFDFKPPRTEDDDGVWASAAGCMRNYLILRDKVAGLPGRPRGAGRRSRPPGSTSCRVPTRGAPASRSPTCGPSPSTPRPRRSAAWRSSTSTSSPSSTSTASGADRGPGGRGRLLDPVLQGARGRRRHRRRRTAWPRRGTPTAPRCTRTGGGTRCRRRSPTPAGWTTWPPCPSVGSSTAWSPSTTPAPSYGRPCSGTTLDRPRRLPT